MRNEHITSNAGGSGITTGSTGGSGLTAGTAGAQSMSNRGSNIVV